MCADALNLQSEIEALDKLGVEYIHLDFMDNHFVPNITLDANLIKSVKSVLVNMKRDIHIMAYQPEQFFDRMDIGQGDIVAVHYEACDDIGKTIEHIHKAGAKAGVSIKPGTAPEVLDDYLKDIDLILVMSVEPGFGGQKFMDSSLPKIEYYKKKRDEMGYDYVIEVDGGIGSGNAHLVRDAGADVIVAGSAVFRAADRSAEIKAIKGE